MGYSFETDDIFPIILAIISRLYDTKRDFVPHKEIANALLNDPEGKRYIQSAYVRQVEYNPIVSKQQIASNMVAWMSQHMSDDRYHYHSLLNKRFERKKIKGRWAYRPRV